MRLLGAAAKKLVQLRLVRVIGIAKICGASALGAQELPEVPRVVEGTRITCETLSDTTIGGVTRRTSVFAALESAETSWVGIIEYEGAGTVRRALFSLTPLEFAPRRPALLVATLADGPRTGFEISVEGTVQFGSGVATDGRRLQDSVTAELFELGDLLRGLPCEFRPREVP